MEILKMNDEQKTAQVGIINEDPPTPHPSSSTSLSASDIIRIQLPRAIGTNAMSFGSLGMLAYELVEHKPSSVLILQLAT